MSFCCQRNMRVVLWTSEKLKPKTNGPPTSCKIPPKPQIYQNFNLSVHMSYFSKLLTTLSLKGLYKVIKMLLITERVKYSLEK